MNATAEEITMQRHALKLYLYAWEFESMPAYNTTLPTGTTIGKVWRQWNKVGMYIEDDDPNMIGIVWFEVELKQGPKPCWYNAPDWSNYAQWQAERPRS
jgi:hypothetical protein